MTLIKSIVDDREYRHFVLDNGLEVLVVQDKTLDKAAASLSVNVGSYADPESLPGLAHFLEHLLFMGTTKYPDESAYMDFLIANAGSANAFTAAEHTNFHFDVAASAFEGALDRFSQFFVSPLFSESCQAREVRAVDSENKKNLREDSWRISQLEKSLSNSLHPWHKFSTGNFETLERMPKILGIDVRSELIEFYHEHYSASLMKLVLIGNQDLDLLEQWAREKFELVPSDAAKSVTTKLKESPLLPEHFGKAIFVEPVKDVKQLEIVFAVPDQQPLVDTQPHLYFSHLLKHEDQNSLLAYFKEMGWATGISAGVTHIATGHDQFLVAVDLTDAGIEAWKTVYAVVLAYIDVIKSNGPQKWFSEEIQRISLDAFNYRPKSKPMILARNLSQAMHRPIPRERLLNFSVVTTYSPQDIVEFGSYLNSANSRAFIVGDTSKQLESVEKWYGTRYHVEDLVFVSVEVSGMSLPEPNPFLSEHYSVTKGNSTLTQSKVGEATLWYKTPIDTTTPKTSVYYTLRSIDVARNPCSELFCALVTEFITLRYGYAAKLAGLEFLLGVGPRGFEIHASGFSSKLIELVKRILEDFSKYSKKEAESDFVAVKQKLCRDLRNHLMAPPYLQLMNYSDFVLENNVRSVAERLHTLEQITIEQLAEFIGAARKFAVEALVIGNISKQDAVSYVSLANEYLGGGNVIPELTPVLLPAGTKAYWRDTLADTQNTNSAIDYCISAGNTSDSKSYANLLVLLQLIQEPVFHQLRTVEQLGYIVGCIEREVGGALYLRIFVQSEEPTTEVEKRIDNTLSVIVRKCVTGISTEALTQAKTAAAKRVLEKPSNADDEARRFWKEILTGRYNFKMRDEIATAIGSVSSQSLVALYAHIDPNSATQARFVTHLVAQKKPPAPPLETALAKSVGRLVFANQLQVNPMEIMKFAMECRGLTVDEAMASLYKRLVAGGQTPEASQKFIQDALAGAQAPPATNAETDTYQGTQVLDAQKFRSSLYAPTPSSSCSTAVSAPSKGKLRDHASKSESTATSGKKPKCMCCTIM